jgi:predicted transcriptional regulator
MKFIEDKELQNLNEENEDLLETKKYAKTLQDIVKNANTPLTVGIFGEWGSGKSSIINTVKNNVDNEKIKFVTYDAWKYHTDSFRRMFLRELSNQLEVKMEDNFESFYVDRNETVKINKKINWQFFIVAIVIIIIAFVTLFIFPENIEIEWKIGIPLFISIIGIGVGISRNLFDSYNVNISRSKIFAPEQFEEIYDVIIKHIFNPESNWEKFKKWIKEKFKGKIEKLVIVIDNLDRCDDNTVFELLTTIKTFLQKENVIFIIPLDDLRLKKFLSENHKLNEKEVDEFLRKIFDVTLKIKSFQPLDIFHYTNELNKKYQLNLQTDTIDIFAKEYATNPRRIIQLINNLLVEKDILKNKYDDSFVNENESLIAKLLIIREEWPDFYKKLQINSRLMNDSKEDSEDNKETISDELNNFLKRTKGYSVNVNIEVIEKIISNIDNDHGISSEIINKLNNHDYNNFEAELIDEKLLYYLFEELSKEIKNQTFKGGALNRFKNIIKLNEIKVLQSNFIKRFDSDYSINDIVKIIENLDDDYFDDLFKFVNLLHKHNFSSLLKEKVKKYNEIWKEDYEEKSIEKLSKIWNDGLDYLINNIEDEQIIKSLQTSFIYFYDYYSDSPLYKNQWINEEKLKLIISQEFIDYLIEKVDEKFEGDSFEELMYLAELKLLNIKQVEKLFEKLNWINEGIFNDSNKAREKCISDLMYKIKNLNKLLKLLNPIEYESKIIQDSLTRIQTIDKKIINYNRPINVNLLNDISSNQEYQKTLLEFYLNIYRDTYNNTNVTNHIQNLVNKYQSLELVLFEKLLELNQKYKFTLKPFIKYLINKKEIDENLLKIYLIYIENKEILKDNYDIVKNKLKELLKQYNAEIEWFFKKILKTDILKKALIELINEDFESFNQLSIQLKRLAFDYICSENLINNFENDIEILKELAKEQYEGCIKNVLVKKVADEKIDEALEILESFKTISPTLWNNLSLIEEYKQVEEFKSRIEDIEKKVKHA